MYRVHPAYVLWSLDTSPRATSSTRSPRPRDRPRRAGRPRPDAGRAVEALPHLLTRNLGEQALRAPGAFLSQESPLSEQAKRSQLIDQRVPCRIPSACCWRCHSWRDQAVYDGNARRMTAPSPTQPADVGRGKLPRPRMDRAPRLVSDRSSDRSPASGRSRFSRRAALRSADGHRARAHRECTWTNRTTFPGALLRSGAIRIGRHRGGDDPAALRRIHPMGLSALYKPGNRQSGLQSYRTAFSVTFPVRPLSSLFAKAAAALTAYGPDFRFQTPVYRRGDVVDGALDGDLILVASGDITMGGRDPPDGTLAHGNIRHTDANAVPSGIATLHGYRSWPVLTHLPSRLRLGITTMRDVIIDARLSKSYRKMTTFSRQS